MRKVAGAIMLKHITAQIGDELPQVVFGPVDRTMLALYAGASQDHNPIHIDIDYAKNAGRPDVFAHGMLSMAQIGRVVTDWAGLGNLRRFSSRFTAVTPVGALVTCRGRVVARLEQKGGPLLKIELSATIDDGTVTLIGDALVSIGEACHR